MSTLRRPSAHARVAVLLALLCVSLSVAGREYTEAQFKTYTDFGSYGDFEGGRISLSLMQIVLLMHLIARLENCNVGL